MVSSLYLANECNVIFLSTVYANRSCIRISEYEGMWDDPVMDDCTSRNALQVKNEVSADHFVLNLPKRPILLFCVYRFHHGHFINFCSVYLVNFFYPVSSIFLAVYLCKQGLLLINPYVLYKLQYCIETNILHFASKIVLKHFVAKVKIGVW